MRKLLFIGVIMPVFFFLTVNPVNAANLIDLSNSNSWNIRYDGSTATANQGNDTIMKSDLNGNGRPDLILPSSLAWNNSLTQSGSLYIIYDDLLASLTTTGRAVDTNDPSTWNVRFDGAAALDILGFPVAVGDINNDDLEDLIFGALGTDYNSRNLSGSLYVVSGTQLSSYSGTGNIVNMGTSTNFFLRFDGAAATSRFGGALAPLIDLNNNGNLDLIVGAWTAGFNSRATSGSFYVIYDSIFSGYFGTGNTIDMATTTNYNIRFDGAVAGNQLSQMGIVPIDINNSGGTDLVVSAHLADFNSRTDSGSAYVLFDSLISSYAGTGNNVDLATSSNYNLRYDGAAGNDNLSNSSIRTSDVNNNGIPDLSLSAQRASFNSRTNSGSLYLIYDELIAPYVGTGNNIDLATSGNFNIRFDGAAATDIFGSTFTLGDYDYDSLVDVITGAVGTDFNSRSSSGSVYMIPGRIFDSYSGTGNSIDMSNEANYSVRFDGASTSDQAKQGAIRPVDINNDGRYDFIGGATGTDYNSRSASGSFYIIYNFPHTFSSLGLSGPILSGQVNASNSPTSLSGVQYLIDSNSINGNWTNCQIQGSQFSCQLNPLTGNHTIYVRAYDTNSFYTAQSNYAQFCFGSCPSTSSGSGSNDPNSQSNWSQPVTVGPKRVGSIGDNGYLFNQGIGAFMSNSITPIDLYINPVQTTTVPTPQGLTTCSPVYDFRAVSSFNGYPVLTSVLPYTIVLNYTPGTNCSKIAYLNQLTNTWTILPGPYVNHPVNQTLATTTNQFSYFAVVSGYQPAAQKKSTTPSKKKSPTPKTKQVKKVKI